MARSRAFRRLLLAVATAAAMTGLSVGQVLATGGVPPFPK